MFSFISSILSHLSSIKIYSSSEEPELLFSKAGEDLGEATDSSAGIKSNIKKKENTVSNCRITTENQAVNVCIEDKIYVFSFLISSFGLGSILFTYKYF